jgi:hypothetical protein
MHTEEYPQPLFVQTGPETYACTRCGAEDCCEEEYWESYGGTTEGYQRCETCGATESFLDMSAVI